MIRAVTRTSVASAVLRRRPSGAIVFDVVLLAFVVLIVVTATGMRPGARLVPLAIGLPTLVLLLFQLVVDVRRSLERRPSVAVRSHRQDGDEAAPERGLAAATLTDVLRAARIEESDEFSGQDPGQARRQLGFALWAIGYISLAALTSFLLATPVAVAIVFLLSGVRPLLALLLAAGTGLGIYVIFDLFLQVRF